MYGLDVSSPLVRPDSLLSRTKVMFSGGVAPLRVLAFFIEKLGADIDEIYHLLVMKPRHLSTVVHDSRTTNIPYILN